MATTDTNVSQLVINRLTKTQFNGATPSRTELWAVDPEFSGNKLLATDANGDIVESNATIPTVNNPTITVTQGGVTKGSFTLNQSTGDTIALDAGGGSPLPSQTGQSGKFLTTDGTDASWGNIPSDSTKANTSLSNLDATGQAVIDGKADSDLNNVSAGIDFVVESYQNGTDWYRLYKSGWVEQGGVRSASSNQTVNLNVQMADTNYGLQIQLQGSGSSGNSLVVTSKNISYFKVAHDYLSSFSLIWEAKGMKAQN